MFKIYNCWYKKMVRKEEDGRINIQNSHCHPISIHKTLPHTHQTFRGGGIAGWGVDAKGKSGKGKYASISRRVFDV